MKFIFVITFQIIFHLIEAKEEYISRFIEGSIGRLTWPSAASCRPDITDKTQTNQNEPPIEPVKLAPLDVRKEEAALLGYMPQRDDFERVFFIIQQIFILYMLYIKIFSNAYYELIIYSI